MKVISSASIFCVITFTSFFANHNLTLIYPTGKISSTFLKIIPTNPEFIPDKSHQNSTKIFLNNIFKNAEVKFAETKDIEFVDQGVNFENVFCNYCGRNIDMELWKQSMDKAGKRHFKLLTFLTPCCHKTTSLNDLKYQWPAGFAKFEISISNPSIDINAKEIKELEKILGTKIRKIWAHY